MGTACQGRSTSLQDSHVLPRNQPASAASHRLKICFVRFSEILNHFKCIPQEEISASAGNLDYENLEDFEIFPGSEMQDFLEKKIYLPNFNKEENDPFSFKSDHLTTEQSKFLKNVINDHKNAISTKTDPVGDFKLFQIALNFFPNKTAHQVKRNLDFDLINQDIQRMADLEIISENFSTDIQTLSNLVIVSKNKRLCKADRYHKKMQDKIEK